MRSKSAESFSETLFTTTQLHPLIFRGVLVASYLQSPTNSPRDFLASIFTRLISFCLQRAVMSYLYLSSSQSSARMQSAGGCPSKRLSIALQDSCNPLAKLSSNRALVSSFLRLSTKFSAIYKIKGGRLKERAN